MKGVLGLIFLALWTPVVVWTLVRIAESCAAAGRPWYLC